MNDFKYVIQARVTRKEEMHPCQRCKKQNANLLYSSYEVKDQALCDAYIAELRKCTSFQAMEHFARTSRFNDMIYEATLKEQRQGPPQMYEESYACSICMADLLSSGMGVAGMGESVLSTLSSSGAVWIVRDVSCPDHWALLCTPYQDVVLLSSEIHTRETVIYE